MIARLSSRHHSIIIIFSSLVLMASGVTWAAPPDGRLLASQCAQCHGTNGNAVRDMESLAGENAQELYNEMLEMKYSNNTSDIMHRQAKGYSEEQLWLIARYYAGLKNGGGQTANNGD